MPEIMQMPENMRLVLLAAQVMAELLVLNERRTIRKVAIVNVFALKKVVFPIQLEQT